jgi:primosomal protein N' (replication factor Y)
MAAAGGCVVIGARAAAFAPMPDPAAFVVIDEHDEALQHEASPTWHARDVVLERARRRNVTAVLTSPCPSLEAVARSPLVSLDRAAERAGWPLVELIDRREDDNARTGLFSERLVRALRADGRVVCVLNRTGRARMLACRACSSVAQCDVCEAAVVAERDDELSCPRCGATRPMVCANCGGTVLKRLRIGVDRAREELEALLREPVAELTGASRGSLDPDVRVVVGTEAALHRVPDARVVAFLDFDSELLATRYRTSDEAMALLARAGRLVGGRGTAGRIVVQTRIPDHEVLRAAVSANPQVLMDRERERRERLGMPPATTIALLGGDAAAELVARLGNPLGVEVRQMGDQWLLVATERAVLLDALASIDRPPGRLRLQIDPMRLS